MRWVGWLVGWRGWLVGLVCWNDVGWYWLGMLVGWLVLIIDIGNVDHFLDIFFKRELPNLVDCFSKRELRNSIFGCFCW